MNTLDAIANTTIECLKTNGFSISRHDDDSPHWCSIGSLGVSSDHWWATKHWATIQFLDTEAVVACGAVGRRTLRRSHHHYANPDYLESLTQHIRGWLHATDHDQPANANDRPA